MTDGSRTGRRPNRWGWLAAGIWLFYLGSPLQQIAKHSHGMTRVVGFLALKGDHGTFFYVDPAAQSAGHGSALFAEAQRARPDGFDFWVFKSPATSSYVKWFVPVMRISVR